MSSPMIGVDLDLVPVVVKNVRRIRRARKLTAQELADQFKAAGVPLTRSIMANLESGRREDLGINELAAFAAAFQVDPWSLTTETPMCLVCRNEAPAGFACLVCNQGRPGGGNASV